jgi:LmbE family N-acetylglucosaminyl deacetylase
MDDLGTILGVWAHPDDEGYLSGGLMAAAVARGDRVTCVTATRGEAADPDRWPPAELAVIREKELAECLAVLGVTDHRWLDYPDFGCAAVDEDEAADRITAIVDEVRPDTVLTFGPDGMTGHPDHQAVSRWTTKAVARAVTHATLYYATHTPGWSERFEAAGRDLNVMMGADALPQTPASELAINLDVVGPLLDVKERAMRAQATQVDDMFNAIGRERYRELLREEAFVLGTNAT